MSKFLTIYPQAGNGGANETCSCVLTKSGINDTWAQIIAEAAATSISFGGGNPLLYIQSSDATDKWKLLLRFFNSFKLAGIPEGSEILSASFNYKTSSVGDGGNYAMEATIVKAAPSNPADIAVGDFSSLVRTELAASRQAWSASAGYKSITLNTAGLLELVNNLGSVITLAMINGYDMDEVSPTWVYPGSSYQNGYTANQSDITSDPYLEIEYEEPAAGSLFFGAEF